VGKKFLLAAAVLVVAAGVAFWVRPVSCFNESLYFLDDLAGVTSKETSIGGYRIHYEVQGPMNGPTVVLIHGLGGRAEDWRDLAPYLAKAGYRVYRPDLIGYGRSEKPADFSYSIRDEAAFVLQFMDALELRQIDLGGWSMGGAIVQHIAAEHPERIRRLLLFDSAGLFVLPTWDLKLFTPNSPEELDRLDVLLMPHPPKLPGFLARDIVRVSNERAWIIHRAINSMLTGRDATDKLVPLLKMPVLIEWGGSDNITPLSLGETLHKMIPQSQFVVVPGCGHLAPDQCAAQMAPTVVAFLKQ